uniref:Uncharacterized protein n=1 Tax=Salix viminalis TaxID=40686 RepID=A0A6N2MSY3_SALVM
MQADAAKTDVLRALMKTPAPKPSSVAHKETASSHLKEAIIMQENHLFILPGLDFAGDQEREKLTGCLPTSLARFLEGALHVADIASNH